MQMFYVCVMCASSGSPQFYVVHDLQFLNAGQGCMGRPYGRAVLQSHGCPWVSPFDSPCSSGKCFLCVVVCVCVLRCCKYVCCICVWIYGKTQKICVGCHGKCSVVWNL